MSLLPHKSLRFMLTVPYVVLVLLAALIIGILSYRAGSNAVDELSDLVLNETVNRITQAVDKHISGSEAVLETVFPADLVPPTSLQDDLESLRVRLWLATSIHRNPNNYAYYGDRFGQFIGLWRYSDSEAELRLRTDSISPRSLYKFSNILGPLENPVVEPRVFEPRDRPWFRAGQNTDTQAWTPIYIDFKTLALVSTRTRRMNDIDGQFEGVVATDVSLQHLNDFLDTLSLSENGVAFIVERNGDIIATSRGPYIHKVAGKDNTRLNAADSDDPLIAATYQVVHKLMGKSESGIHTTAFDTAQGAIVQAGYSRLQDTAGLDWYVAVAVPRQDFMHRVTRNIHRSMLMAVAVCALIVLLGLFTLSRVAADLRQLAGAARAMGDGDLSASVPLERADEIGELAKSFSSLQERLLTDRLTGIANREAIVRRIESRILDHQGGDVQHPFALLFIDMNGFKEINDNYGHDAGDRVLVEVAERLMLSLRGYDMAARFGGDEFVVLLDKAGQRSVVALVCERLKVALDKPYEVVLTGAKSPLLDATGASIGFAMYPDDGQDLETLMKCADAQMYKAKSASKETL